MVPKKLLWLSKSFWFGLLTAVYGLLNIFFQLPLPSEQILGYVAAGWGSLAMVLRFITKDKVVLVD